MRHSRIKPENQDTWHHCFNRICGTALDLPFTAADKEQFIRILERVGVLYTIKVVSFQVLDNHFHVLLQAPAAVPSERETCQRFEAFHHGKRVIYPGTKRCQEWQARLRDVSWFMRHLQQLFTVWYNKSRPNPRRGPLWSGRFKNTILESGMAVWRCLNYIECNALRAGLVAHPAQYRFGSYGRWIQSGQHPFQQNIEEILLPMLSGILNLTGVEHLKVVMEEGFARVISTEMETEPREDAVALTVKRRVRYWTEGLVIGSELFVRNVMSHIRGRDKAAKQRLTCINAAADPDLMICSWHRLRV